MSEDGDVYNIWKQMLNAEFKLDKIIELEKGFDIMAKDHQQVVIDITELEKAIKDIGPRLKEMEKNYEEYIDDSIKRFEKLELKDVENIKKFSVLNALIIGLGKGFERQHECLRKLFKRFEKANSTTTFYTKLLDKLGGDTASSASHTDEHCRTCWYWDIEGDGVCHEDCDPLHNKWKPKISPKEIMKETESQPPSCKKCGNLMEMDINTLNSGDYYCRKCDHFSNKNPSEEDARQTVVTALEKEHSKQGWKCTCAHCQSLRKIQERGYIPVEKADLEEIFSFIDFSEYDGTDIMDESRDRVDELEKKYLKEEK